MRHDRVFDLTEIRPPVPEHLRGTRAALFQLWREAQFEESGGSVENLTPKVVTPIDANADLKANDTEQPARKTPDWRDAIYADSFEFWD